MTTQQEPKHCYLQQNKRVQLFGPRNFGLVGDYGYWSQTQTPPYSSAQIPFAKLTHINHAGVSFGGDGSLSVPSGFLEPALISKAHAAGVKVLLLLGGDFTGLETTTGGLQTLLANLQTFIATNGYDGLDIDWEYPSSTGAEKPVRQRRAKLSPPLGLAQGRCLRHQAFRPVSATRTHTVPQRPSVRPSSYK